MRRELIGPGTLMLLLSPCLLLGLPKGAQADVYVDFRPVQLTVVPSSDGRHDVYVDFVTVYGGDSRGEPILLQLTGEGGEVFAEGIVLRDVGDCCAKDAECPRGFTCNPVEPVCSTKQRGECVGNRRLAFEGVEIPPDGNLTATLDPEGRHREQEPPGAADNSLPLRSEGGVFRDFGIEGVELTPLDYGRYRVEVQAFVAGPQEVPPSLSLVLIQDGETVATIGMPTDNDGTKGAGCCDPDDPNDPHLKNNCGMGKFWICFCPPGRCPTDRTKNECRCASAAPPGELSLSPSSELLVVIDPEGSHVELDGITDNNSIVVEVPLP